ncbi:hypothetical protein, partial [Filifactor alocis]|uniref:hypothetical protein n=1 Tax=Filifactor alocis TaxID=143361 RepID=UPI003F9F0574
KERAVTWTASNALFENGEYVRDGVTNQESFLVCVCIWLVSLLSFALVSVAFLWLFFFCCFLLFFASFNVI